GPRKTAKVVGSSCFREHLFITARLRWTLPESHGPGRDPMHAGSLASPSGWPLSHQSTNAFISALPTVVPTTKYGEITRRNTSPCLSTNGRGCGRKHRDSTSLMWIWYQESGRRSR